MTDTEKAIRALTRGIDGGPGGSGYPICKGCGRVWMPDAAAPDGGHADGCSAAILDAERETIAALRRELAETHEKHAMEFQRADKYRAELAARTEERDAANLALKYARAALDSRRSVIP